MKYKIDEYPEDLTYNRNIVEGNFVFGLYANPELYEEFKHLNADEMNGEIRLDEGRFYFNLGREMFNLGYKNFDDITIFSFLETKIEYKKKFEDMGGYEPIREAKSLIDSENIEAFYDELSKNNLLLELYEKGFNVRQDLEKFKTMRCEDVYDFYDYALNSVSLGSKIKRLETVNLSEGYDDFVKTWDSGVGAGFKLGFPILNYNVAGLHLGTFNIVGAHINKGKSSILIPMLILPMLEIGENITIIANEQQESEWRMMILATVLFNKVGYFGMNRSKFLYGHFSDEDKKNIKLAQEWLESQSGKIVFAHLFDYDIKTVKKIIKKYAKINHKIFIYDTMKPEVENDVRAWADFSQSAKMLFQVAHQQNVAIISTVQLSGESQKRRFLDLSCIGKSKAIAETSATCLLFRPLRTEELDPDSSKYVKVWKHARDKVTRKLTNIKEEIALDMNKNYIVLFISKNRFGEADLCIVYERNLAFNIYYEKGYTNSIPYDAF